MAFFIVVNGRVRLQSDNGGAGSLDYGQDNSWDAQRGDSFGEAAVLSQIGATASASSSSRARGSVDLLAPFGPQNVPLRSSTAVCVRDCELVMVSVAAFKRIMDKSPLALAHAARSLAKRMMASVGGGSSAVSSVDGRSDHGSGTDSGDAGNREEPSLISMLGVGPAVSSMLYSGAVGVDKLSRFSSTKSRTIAIVAAGRQSHRAADLRAFGSQLARALQALHGNTSDVGGSGWINRNTSSPTGFSHSGSVGQQLSDLPKPYATSSVGVPDEGGGLKHTTSFAVRSGAHRAFGRSHFDPAYHGESHRQMEGGTSMNLQSGIVCILTPEIVMPESHRTDSPDIPPPLRRQNSWHIRRSQATSMISDAEESYRFVLLVADDGRTPSESGGTHRVSAW